MFKPSTKISLFAWLLFILLFVEACQQQDVINTSPENPQTGPAALQEIKGLGFSEKEIKDYGEYYLVEGNLYFAKTLPTPKEKPKQKATAKYPVFKIHVDESVSKNEAWVQGIEKMITEWNARKEVHFHFALDNSTDADIHVMEDSNLPKDVAIATDYPRNGRIGSAIRINPNYVYSSNARANATQALSQSLKHCVGFKHADVDKAKKMVAQESSSARTELTVVRLKQIYLLAIQGDILYSRNMSTNKTTVLSDTWMGSSAMTDINSTLYVLQFGYLYEVNPKTGVWTTVMGGWEGATCMTSSVGQQARGFNIVIMQNNVLWGVGRDGSYDVLNVSAPGTFAMLDAGPTDVAATTLIILQKSKFITGSYLYATEYNSSDGDLRLATKVQSDGTYTAKKVSLLFNPNIFAGLTGTGLIFANNKMYFLDSYGDAVSAPGIIYSGKEYSGVEAVTSYLPRYRKQSDHSLEILVIAGGTLWRIGDPFNPDNTRTQLDNIGDWTGTKLITTMSL